MDKQRNRSKSKESLREAFDSNSARNAENRTDVLLIATRKTYQYSCSLFCPKIK